MKKIRTIAFTELRSLFYSPIAWLILVLFSFQTAITFTGGMKSSLQSEIMGKHFPNDTMWTFRFGDMLDFIYLYIPLLTMGLMSREQSTGSIKLLYSSPVSNTQIVLGKYLSMLLYGLVLISVLASYSLFGVFTIKNIDFPIVITSLCGIYLLFSCYAAIGLFMSCLTSYQVAAAIGTVALFACLNYVNHVGQGIAFVRDITYWLSITGRTTNLLAGLINSEDVVYFVIIVVMFIVLSILKLNSEKSKLSLPVNVATYSAVVLVAIAFGYLTSRPSLMRFYDVTRTKMNTLTPNSQEIVGKLKGPLTIITYVNLFEKNAWQALPEQVNFDKQSFKAYIRFKPDVKMKYVYYYAQTDQPSNIGAFPGLTDQQRLMRACATYDLDPDLFLSEVQLRKQIDLSGEHYHFIRLIETEDGKKGYLRLFNDLTKSPGEREITAALKRLATKLPTVGFVECHGGRDINKTGDKGYSNFTTSNVTRNALINQGFDVQSLDLTDSSPIPPLINIIVIADLKSALSESETKKLYDYTSRGGNLLLIGEPGTTAMNSIATHFGVNFLPGRLVQPRPNYAADLIAVHPTKAAAVMSYGFQDLLDENGILMMNGACGLEYTQSNGFEITPWFETGPKGTWNDAVSTEFADGGTLISPNSDEDVKSYTTVVALTKQVGSHQQRIVVMGDADCLDNAELTTNRKGIHAMNWTFINGLFYWLSNGEVPIDVRRTIPTDNEIKLTLSGMSHTKTFFVWIMPSVLALFGFQLLARRRKQ